MNLFRLARFIYAKLTFDWWKRCPRCGKGFAGHELRGNGTCYVVLKGGLCDAACQRCVDETRPARPVNLIGGPLCGANVWFVEAKEAA